MRGYDEFNFPAFKRAALALRKHGLHIASPAEKDQADGFDWAGTKGTSDELHKANFQIHVALLADIEIIAAPLCAGVICLPGWERSSGARAETTFAWACGKTVRQYLEPCRSNGFNHELLNVVPIALDFDFDETLGSIEVWED
jgi:hypothetical protein